jgi:peptidoglycan hydrolase-like protein with peptidoglycan-binding domain
MDSASPEDSSQASHSDDQHPDSDFNPEPNPTEGPESGRSRKPIKRKGENKPVPSADGDTGSMALSIDDEGPPIRRLQRRLRDLRYWVGSVDGVFGSLTQQAVYAFQGIESLARDGVVGAETRSALNDAVRPAVQSTNGLVVEINESAQVLMVAENGRIR